MGLLDSILGAALGGNNQQGGDQNIALQLIMSLIQQNGGVSGLLGKLQQGGLGDALGSWVSTGANQEISGSQLNSALGADTIGNIASQFGLDSSQAGDLLAKVLPGMIDQMTPNGHVNDVTQAEQSGGLDLGSIGAMVLKNLIK